jgi:hypothetical protein
MFGDKTECRSGIVSSIMTLSMRTMEDLPFLEFDCGWKDIAVRLAGGTTGMSVNGFTHVG